MEGSFDEFCGGRVMILEIGMGRCVLRFTGW